MIPLHFLSLSLLACWASAHAVNNARAGKPNVVFILTDDQDKQLDSLDYMQAVRRQLVEQGTSYERHYCTVALCCPSRVNLLTGRMAHNTKVTDLRLPFGGYNKFVQEHLNQDWIAPWMQKAGYKTYYTGKFMNDHDKDNYNNPFPGGLDRNDFLIGPGTYSYLNPLFQHNREVPKRHDKYATDLLANKSYAFIEEGARSGKPFFITVATVAPHASGDKGQDDQNDDLPETRGEGNAPIPAPRHRNLFPNAQVPRTANFNPDQASGASWVRNLKKQTPENEAYNDLYYRRRLQALQAVDDLVDGTIDKLRQLGVLDNTYIIYSTDNGFHIGQHRLQPGKRCPYEEDINIPLIIRGPGVPKGEKRSDIVSSHTDIVPTILGWAGAPLPPNLDGKAIPTTGNGGGKAWEHTQVEHWGVGSADGIFGKGKVDNNTYKAIRVIGEGYNLYYAVWCNNEHELYDMTKDKVQMNNIYNNPSTTFTIGGRQVTLKQLQNRLDTLLLVMKDCKGDTCRRPWKALHSSGAVDNLADALREGFDTFYAQRQKRVAFQRCTQGYLPQLEQPVGFETFGGT